MSPAREDPTGVAGLDVLGYACAYGQRGERLRAELRRQADEIASECERRGLSLLEVISEGESQRHRPLERPGFSGVVARIAAGEACGLVVSDLSSISDSARELGRVLELLTDCGFRLVARVPGLDTGEEAGRIAVNTLIEVSQWEHQRLVERTREGMRASGQKGPPRVADDPQLRDRIARMRTERMSLQAIADQLNAEGVPTVRGGAKWRPSSVQVATGYRRPHTGRRRDLSPSA